MTLKLLDLIFLSEWWLWWKALRTQEFYDQRFFPLQENVDNLFTLLDRLEKKPDLGVVLSKYQVYLDDLRQRLVAKRSNLFFICAQFGIFSWASFRLDQF